MPSPRGALTIPKRNAVARAQRTPRHATEPAHDVRRTAAQHRRHANSTINGNIGPRARTAIAKAQNAPGAHSTTLPIANGVPSSVGCRSAPVIAIVASRSNRSSGPIIVASSVAASGRLPSSAFARPCDNGSKGPETGTPRC